MTERHDYYHEQIQYDFDSLSEEEYEILFGDFFIEIDGNKIDPLADDYDFRTKYVDRLISEYEWKYEFKWKFFEETRLDDIVAKIEILESLNPFYHRPSWMNEYPFISVHRSNQLKNITQEDLCEMSQEERDKTLADINASLYYSDFTAPDWVSDQDLERITRYNVYGPMHNERDWAEGSEMYERRNWRYFSHRRDNG